MILTWEVMPRRHTSHATTPERTTWYQAQYLLMSQSNNDLLDWSPIAQHKPCVNTLRNTKGLMHPEGYEGIADDQL